MAKEKAIVIGAGLGGIAAAVSLAAAGGDVVIFEKNDKIGGKLNLLKTDGFSFDLGPSILLLPRIFEELFERAGRQLRNYVSLVEVRPHWRNFFEDGAVIDLSPEPGVTVRGPVGVDDMKRLGRYLTYSRRQYRRINESYFAKGYDTAAEFILGYGPFKSLGIDLFSRMQPRIDAYVQDEKLRHILGFFAKYVGSSPYDAPGLMNLLAWAQFGFGLWYVQGGMYNLARALGRLLEDLHVAVHLNSEVVEITKSGGSVTGVTLKNGETHTADVVVSDMEVVPTYERLLGEKPSFIRKFRKFEPSCSGLVLHLGVRQQYPQLAHHNFFFSKDPRKHFDEVFHKKVLPEDPTLYVVAPARTDATQAPPLCENIKVLPHIPYIRDAAPYSRQAYLEFRERVLDKLERMGLAGLRQNIVIEDLWTPDDLRDRYYSNKGAIYGVVADRSMNHGFKAPKKSRKYRRLYFVGGSVNPGGGMPMAVLSGMRAADRILHGRR